MSYVNRVLEPGERVVAVGKLHWIIYANAALFALSGLILFFVLVMSNPNGVASNAGEFNGRALAGFVLLAFLILGSISFVRAWFTQWTTELAITDRRVIYKTGFIRRSTAEMNMDKVETVNVDQSILGRFLNYGTLHIRGTGTGIEHLHQISNPLELRTAVTAK
jgi:uncharacterized membrane protein YdbT with pleckstrin-like domain